LGGAEEARGPRTMNPDLPDDVEIGYSSSRMLPLVALAATATTALISASIASGCGGISDRYTLVGFVGLALFGVANEFIRWDSMAAASSSEFCRLSLVALKTTPPLEPQRFITRLNQAMLNANRAMGVDGDAISPSGSTADFDMLLDAYTADLAAAKHASAARARKGGAASQGIVQCA
jgi:hypothetical protein